MQAARTATAQLCNATAFERTRAIALQATTTGREDTVVMLKLLLCADTLRKHTNNETLTSNNGTRSTNLGAWALSHALRGRCTCCCYCYRSDADRAVQQRDQLAAQVDSVKTQLQQQADLHQVGGGCVLLLALAAAES
jgi:hypothetical protein